MAHINIFEISLKYMLPNENQCSKCDKSNPQNVVIFSKKIKDYFDKIFRLILIFLISYH
jgi:hypothetical protein